jgi:hypothetical protein
MNTSRKHLIFSLIAGLIFGVAISIAPLVDARIYNPSSASALSGTVPVTSGGTGTSTAFSERSIIFATSTGAYSEDPGRFTWNNANGAQTLTVGTSGGSASGAVNIGGTVVSLNINGYSSAGAVIGTNSGSNRTLTIGNSGAGGHTTSFFRGTGGDYIAIGTSTATHQLTIGTTTSAVAASAGGIALYNTADQVTNYERFIAQFSANVFTLGGQAAGTGTGRSVRLRSETNSGTASSITLTRATPPYFNADYNQTNVTGNTPITRFAAATHNASSNVQNIFGISPIITQTSTAGYTALLVQPTETSNGSGPNLLIQAGTAATTTLWALDNNGHHITGGKTPVLSSCGSGPSISGSDHSGTVTGGTGSTGCTVTFGTAYATAPHCTVTPRTGSVLNAFSYTISTTALTVTQTGLDTGLFDYVCTQ